MNVSLTREEIKSILGFVKSSYQCERDTAQWCDKEDKEFYLQQARNWKSIGNKLRKILKKK